MGITLNLIRVKSSLVNTTNDNVSLGFPFSSSTRLSQNV